MQWPGYVSQDTSGQVSSKNLERGGQLNDQVKTLCIPVDLDSTVMRIALMLGWSKSNNAIIPKEAVDMVALRNSDQEWSVCIAMY